MLDWTPSPTLPAKPVSFAGVSHGEMVERAKALAPKLRERAALTERLRRLPEETERDLHEAGLFRIVQPARVGGAELDMGILVDTCAAIAEACPSTAWNLGNLGSHHWMLGFFPPAAQDEIWSKSPDTLIATSLAFPAGRGRKVDGGYLVAGRWPLSSGVDNSDWNMLATTMRDDPAGPPVDHRFVLLHRSQYEIIDTWHAMGLCGTGSKDVAAAELFVPDYRTVSVEAFTGGPHPGLAVNPGPLFRLPMLALGPFVLAGMLLGTARGAYNVTVGAAAKRAATNSGLPMSGFQAVQLKVAEVAAQIDTAALIMAHHCGHASEVAKAGHTPLLEDKLRYRRDGAFASQLCFRAIDTLQGVSGSSGIYNNSDMQRFFRDAHAAAAHVMFSFDLQGILFGQHALGATAPPAML
ncbi:MAG: acyl-CoA dehydrogenase [Alphaproteobacteria bacterium]|nr:acyl-CoA dehydrogenase [Alphaproteobacteria bacterium]